MTHCSILILKELTAESGKQLTKRRDCSVTLSGGVGLPKETQRDSTEEVQASPSDKAEAELVPRLSPYG